MYHDEQGALLGADVKRLDFIAWMGLCRLLLWSICFGRCCYDSLEFGLEIIIIRYPAPHLLVHTRLLEPCIPVSICLFCAKSIVNTTRA